MWQAIFVVLAVIGQTEPAEPAKCAGHWVGYADYLNWQSRSSGWMTPVQFHQPTLPFPSSETHIHHLIGDPGRGSGVRGGLGRQFANGWEAVWNYTSFHTDQTVHSPRMTYYQTYGFEDIGGLPRYSENVTTESKIDYGIHDIELAHCFTVTDSLDMRVFGGFRWAMLATHRHVTIIDPVDNDDYAFPIDADLGESTDLDAYGIRIGTQINWRFGYLSLFGRGAISGLYATIDDHTRYNASATTNILWDDRYTGGTSCIETAAGLSFTYQNIEIAAGYELAVWSDVLPDSMRGYEEETEFHDLVLDGLFARVSCRY